MSLIECGPVRINRNVLREVGDDVPPHTHHAPHASRCCEGALLVRLTTPKGVTTEHAMWPGDWLYVPAEAWHHIIARAPMSSFECVFPPDASAEVRAVL